MLMLHKNAEIRGIVMGFFSSVASSFTGGLRKGQYGATSDTPPPRDDLPPPVTSSRDFENRLLRARTEPLRFLRQSFMGGRCISADVHNDQSGGTYHVTAQTCECEDFIKHGQPCKHMIYFALKTGDFRRYEKRIPPSPPRYNGDNFIPFYGRYYSGPPTGVGYKNLYPYRVVGRAYGVSKKTGRPTNRKREITVNAASVEDAQTAAEAMGVMPPYAEVTLLDVSPSYNQLSYLHAVGIPFPLLVTADDVSALLTRHQAEQDDICPSGLFSMATARRVGVSYFAAPQSVAGQIWYCALPAERSALFCYAAYCRELECEIGCAPLPYTDSLFQTFTPTQKQQLDYIKHFSPSFPIRSMSRQSHAYSAAVFHIRRQSPWLLP